MEWTGLQESKRLLNRDDPESLRPLRGAIIGFGNAAIHTHLPAWQKNRHFGINDIFEPSPVQAQWARDILPEARIYSEMGPLLASHDLDFVDICSPPCFHADLLLAACRAGLHVICEKPLVTFLESLLPIQQAAKAFQRVIFTVNNWKYAPLWIKAAELIREEKIGTVRSISLTVLRPPNSGGGVSNWRKCPEISGGGILLDHGWHHLYLILSLLQEPPRFISARMEGPPAKGSSFLDETTDLVMRFSAAEARLRLTWHASCRRNYGTITGEKGSLFIEDDQLLLCLKGLPSTSYNFTEALSASSHHWEWMESVIEDFRQEVLDVNLRGVNLSEAKWCAHLTHLAYQSHREGSRFIPVGEPPA